MQQDTPQPKPASRIGWRIYIPALLLVFALLAGAVGWNHVRGRTVDALAAWRAGEAQAGRVWTCPDESVGGFPFRIEVRCARPTLVTQSAGGPVRAELAGLMLVAQVYDPNVVIAEAQGPFVSRLPDGTEIELNWRSLRSSLAHRARMLERTSHIVEEPAVRVTRPGEPPVVTRGERIELHLRPNPARYAADGSVDLSLEATGFVLPMLDIFTGERGALSLRLAATATRAYGLAARGAPDALESWRLLGGAVSLSPLEVTKGDLRLLARGDLAIDEGRHLTGRLDMAGAGLEPLVARLTGEDSRAGALIISGLRALSARRERAAPSAPGGNLQPLLPLRFAQGRFYLGPFPLGTLPTLY